MFTKIVFLCQCNPGTKDLTDKTGLMKKVSSTTNNINKQFNLKGFHLDISLSRHFSIKNVLYIIYMNFRLV